MFTPIQRAAWLAPFEEEYEGEHEWVGPISALVLLVPFFFASWFIEYLIAIRMVPRSSELSGASPRNVFITADQGLEYQQNLTNVEIAVIVLLAPTNRFQDLKPLAPRILEALGEARPVGRAA